MSPTVFREDTRIPALGKDVSEYDFLAPAGGGAVRVEAKLVFRRAFRQLSIWKQWNDADILMKQSAVSVAANPSGIAPLAVVHAATQQGDVPLAQGAIATVYGAGLASRRAARASSSATNPVPRPVPASCMFLPARSTSSCRAESRWATPFQK